MNLLESNMRKMHELCKLYKVKNLYAFGSILTPRFNIGSDVDFLVNFNKKDIPMQDYADNFFNLQFALEDLLGRKVDLVCDDAVKNPYFRIELDRTKHLIYG